VTAQAAPQFTSHERGTIMTIKSISALAVAALFSVAACQPQQDTTIETEAPAEEPTLYEVETVPAEHADTLILEGEEIEVVDEVETTQPETY
jgi:hypothetical protein